LEFRKTTSVCSKELLDVINKTKDNTDLNIGVELWFEEEIVNAVKKHL
jgi:hypothetical protein